MYQVLEMQKYKFKQIENQQERQVCLEKAMLIKKCPDVTNLCSQVTIIIFSPS